LVGIKILHHFRNRKLTMLFMVLFVSNIAYAGRIEKAYDALSIYNYFKAKRLFEKRLKKEVVASAFGLSIIYGRSDNPFTNIDSAHKYIYLAANQAQYLNDRERERLNRLGVDSTDIQMWKDTIDYKGYEVVMEEGNLFAFKQYIASHPNSKWKDKVVESRNALAFTLAKEENSVAAYKNFIFQYPTAIQITEAQSRYEKRLYENITKNGSLSSFELFVKQYPKSPFHLEAQDSLYKIATAQNTIDNYHEFIENHPENRNVNKAWNNIYKLYMHEYSLQRIAEFQIDFPNYPFVSDLKIDMELAQKPYLPFRINDSWGYMDTLGAIMLAPIYESVEPFKNGLALVVKGGKVGYINKTGEAVIPFQYSDGEAFDQGLAVVEKDGFYGVIDRTNQTIIPYIYDLIGAFNSDLAMVANDTAYGYINKKGEVVIPLTLSYADDFKNGFALIEQHGKKGIINTRGREIVPSSYEWLEPFNEDGVCRAKKDSLYGLLNNEGTVILPFEYDAIGVFSEGYALIAKNKKYGYVNIRGEIKIPMQFDYKSDALIWGQFENGYAKYFLEQKFGIIDTAAKKVFPAIFESIGNYNDSSWIAVRKRGKWGYSNQLLQLMIPYRFDYASTFIGDYAIVQSEGEWGVIDRKGSYVVPKEYSEIRYLKDWGYLLTKNEQTKMRTPMLLEVDGRAYDKIEEYNGQFLRLEVEGGNYYYLSKRTNKIIKPSP